ncbi:hypothetical protein ABZ891_26640 [Streptomyces sp. NPDC047023]|uniref:hypothetical protein n=1 Tax=Streptomyces sp. NPDC047023 TaxID=3155139 RepID=UPI0033D72457
MRSDPVDLMAEAWAAFDESLRMGQGIDEELYVSLRQALRSCAEEWVALDLIPRAGANVLVDIFAATEANSSLYEGDVADRVMEVAYELHELVGECVAL